MHAKPDLRVFLKWMIAGSGSVITDVIWLQIMATLNQLGEYIFTVTEFMSPTECEKWISKTESVGYSEATVSMPDGKQVVLDPEIMIV